MTAAVPTKEGTQGVTVEAGQGTITERQHAVPDAERVSEFSLRLDKELMNCF